MYNVDTNRMYNYRTILSNKLCCVLCLKDNSSRLYLRNSIPEFFKFAVSLPGTVVLLAADRCWFARWQLLGNKWPRSLMEGGSPSPSPEY